MGQEAVIQRRVTTFARMKGALVLRLALQPAVAGGWPDALIILPNGRVLWIEFKAPGKTPTPLQLRRHADLRRLGHDVRVIESVEAGCAATLEALGS